MPPPSKTIPVVDRSIRMASHLRRGVMVEMAKTGKIGFMPDHQPVKNRIIVQIEGRRIAYKLDLEYFILVDERPPRVEYRKVKPRKVSFVNKYAAGILPPVDYDENGEEL